MELVPRHQAKNCRPADKLAGTVALITGGDSGMGRAVALVYARKGADVAIVYLPGEESDAKEIKREIDALGRRAAPLPGDS